MLGSVGFQRNAFLRRQADDGRSACCSARVWVALCHRRRFNKWPSRRRHGDWLCVAPRVALKSAQSQEKTPPNFLLDPLRGVDSLVGGLSRGHCPREGFLELGALSRRDGVLDLGPELAGREWFHDVPADAGLL